MRVLPADVYDTLEMSALAFGGIGGGQSFVNLDTQDIPLCALGHATFATDIPFQTVLVGGVGAVVGSVQVANPIARALKDIGIFGGENDDAVAAINRRRGVTRDNLNSLWKRVPFDAWCKELDVVRGES